MESTKELLLNRKWKITNSIFKSAGWHTNVLGSIYLFNNDGTLEIIDSKKQEIKLSYILNDKLTINKNLLFNIKNISSSKLILENEIMELTFNNISSE